jgi:hypothetical protein
MPMFEPEGDDWPVVSKPSATLSWPRAIVVTVVVAALGVLLLVVVPNLLITQLGGLSRGWRAGLATVWFVAMLAALAWLLRRLQARRLI